MSVERTVVISTNVMADDEEEELAVLPNSAARGSVGTRGNVSAGKNIANDMTKASGESDDEDDLIKYVAHPLSSSSSTARIGAVQSSASVKRPRGADDDFNKETIALDMAAEDSLLPDDTDYPRDAAEYERWRARDASRQKKAILALLSGVP
uniref:Uncharacterized protein n=1 Tax=Trypanosoma congolense (strain IL3000) TaxID=1068625 RepID=G0UMK3_TRYCI|nr:conserved hypothetical protein [Trypanosoma congolense IL3000]